MALDPDDILDPPYGFGECEEATVLVPVHCDAWKVPDDDIAVTIRRVGDRHTIHFPTFLRSSKKGILTSDCDVVVDMYYYLASEDSSFHITNANSRHFQGSMQIYDEKYENERVCHAAIDYDIKQGSFIFEPVTNFPLNEMSSTADEVFEVGILPTTVTIDEEGLMEDEEPAEIIDVDLDYEDERQDAPFIEPDPDPVDPDPVDPDDPTPTPTIESQTYEVSVMCGAWVDGTSQTAYKTVVNLTKNNETKRCVMNIQEILHPSTSNGPEKSSLVIKLPISSYQSFLGGYIPPVSLLIVESRLT